MDGEHHAPFLSLRDDRRISDKGEVSGQVPGLERAYKAVKSTLFNVK